jgi:membrane-anchored protein YejM (alkaline phosphatase superfamily)
MHVHIPAVSTIMKYILKATKTLQSCKWGNRLLEEGTKTKWVITGEANVKNPEYGRMDEGVVNKTRFYQINGHLGAEIHNRNLC